MNNLNKTTGEKIVFTWRRKWDEESVERGRATLGRLWGQDKGPRGGIRRKPVRQRVKDQLCVNVAKKEKKQPCQAATFSCEYACWRGLGLSHVTMGGHRLSLGFEVRVLLGGGYW